MESDSYVFKGFRLIEDVLWKGKILIEFSGVFRKEDFHLLMFFAMGRGVFEFY